MRIGDKELHKCGKFVRCEDFVTFLKIHTSVRAKRRQKEQGGDMSVRRVNAAALEYMEIEENES